MARIRAVGAGLQTRAATTLALVSTALLIACSSTVHAPTATALRPASPTPTPVLNSDLGRTIENAVLACREKDAVTLRALIAGDVSQQQIDALFALGRDVVLKSQTPSINGDQASVAVDLLITRATGAENVQRTWRLTQGAGSLWRFDALPDCY